MRNTFRIILPLLLLLGGALHAEEPLRFAFITDTHLAEGAASIADLRACIKDMNKDRNLDFVIFGGDITDFGTDSEIALAKSMIDSLRHTHYILAGNHDANWSESGCNTFLRTFGYEQFTFEAKGWRFIGCNSGPDMRMAPGLVPVESVNFLETLDGEKKSIFFNHYPMDTSVLNYSRVTRALKKADVRMQIGGHWHRNASLNYEGIPGITCRSSLSRGNHTGYTIVRLWEDSVEVRERRIWKDSQVELTWYTRSLSHVVDTVTYDKDGLPGDYPWMRFDVNEKYPQVKELWKIQDDYNIVAGMAVDKEGGRAYYTTSAGHIRAVDMKDGTILWSVRLPGKVYSTPALSGRRLVVGCSDGAVYALDTERGGEQLWRAPARKSVLACPLIVGRRVYIGASDGVFRCLDLESGREVWAYEGVEGHVVSTPFVDEGQVVFGSWGRTLYSLDPATGEEQWKWVVPRPARNYSPASTVPFKAAGRIFVAVPDRNVYAIDALTGEQSYVSSGGRDAIGMNEKGTLVYSKTMQGRVYALDPATGRKVWEKSAGTGYELAPTALSEKSGVLLVPTDKGNLVAMDSSTGDFLWAHKLALALVNPLHVTQRGGDLLILASTMDGTLTLLEAPIK